MVLTSSLSTKGTRRHWVWDISGEHAGWWALFMAAAWLSVISVNSRVTVRDLQGLKTAGDLDSSVLMRFSLLLLTAVWNWQQSSLFHLLMRVTNLNNWLSVVTLLQLQWALNISTLISRQALYVSWCLFFFLLLLLPLLPVHQASTNCLWTLLNNDKWCPGSTQTLFQMFVSSYFYFSCLKFSETDISSNH